jgi:hypothetical protein
MNTKTDDYPKDPYLNALIDKIQEARGGPREVFPSILNDVMVALGWTEQQATEQLDTTETTIGRWMSGANIPTASVRESTYERMICALVEADVLQGSDEKYVRDAHRYFWSYAFPIGLVGICVMIAVHIYLR